MLSDCQLAKGERTEIRFADSHPRLQSAFRRTSPQKFLPRSIPKGLLRGLFIKGGRQFFLLKMNYFCGLCFLADAMTSRFPPHSPPSAESRRAKIPGGDDTQTPFPRTKAKLDAGLRFATLFARSLGLRPDFFRRTDYKSKRITAGLNLYY
jgi:hypothetical protein